MKGVEWGSLYNSHKSEDLDLDKIEAETAKLILDDDVTAKIRNISVYSYPRRKTPEYPLFHTVHESQSL